MNEQQILARIVDQVERGEVFLTLHAHQRLIAHAFSYDDLLCSVKNGRILEAYPKHERGPCCLLFGTTSTRRPMHIVGTIGRPVFIVITVCAPVKPKWITPDRRAKEYA